MNALSGKRVLVVEDEAMIADMVEDMLSQLGAVVIGPVGTLAKGLELARSEVLDAAMLDVNIRSDESIPWSKFCARAPSHSSLRPAMAMQLERRWRASTFSKSRLRKTESRTHC